MKKDVWTGFSNPVVKQGNSFCVRIPGKFVKELNLQEGDVMAVKLQKLKIELTEKAIEDMITVANKHKELNKMSKEKKIVLSTLAFNEGKEILEKKGREFYQESKKITKAEAKKILEVQNNYRDKLKKEFGVHFYKEYLLFREKIEKEITKKSH